MMSAAVLSAAAMSNADFLANGFEDTARTWVAMMTSWMDQAVCSGSSIRLPSRKASDI